MSSPKVLRESNLINETIYYEDLYQKRNKIDSKITIIGNILKEWLKS